MSWQPAKIGSLGAIFDGPHATPTRRSEGKYFLNISSLKSGRLDLAESDQISEEDFTRWTRRVQPQEGDLLFSYETRLGDAARMPAGLDACLGRRMALIRPNPTAVDDRFLLYAWLSPHFQHTIQTRKTPGATVERIPLKELSSWEMMLPPLKQQRAIGEVLGALDDKIAANREIVRLADTTRVALWKQLTVGARSAPLSSVADFINGGAYTRDATGTGRVIIRIAELNSGLTSATVRSEIKVPDRHVVMPGDLLMSWSGSLVWHRWFREEAVLNQHIFKVVARDCWRPWAVACAVQALLPTFRSIASDKATTMGHIQRTHLETPLPLPGVDAIEAVNTAGDSLWSRALTAERESEQLAATRDELLPLLMEGRITVKDAEKTVEGVV